MLQPFSPLYEEFKLWSLGLRQRRLVWLAWAAILGCAAGPQWAQLFQAQTRDVLWIWLPLILALPCFVLAFNERKEIPETARLLVWTGIFLSCATYNAYRVLPAPDDVSRLIALVQDRGQIFQTVSVELVGTVTQDPQQNGLRQNFVLDCESVRALDATTKSPLSLPQQTWRGQILVQSKARQSVLRGDKVFIKATLYDLPRTGNPTERVRYWSAVEQGCWCNAVVENANDVRLLRSSDDWLTPTITRIRRNLLSRYQHAFSSLHVNYPLATAQIMTAMVFGEGGLQEPLPDLIRDNFRAAGLSHVLVASGSQISIGCLAILGLCRLIGWRHVGTIMLVIPILVCYALVAGGAASIWRALIAGTCLAGAWVLGRDNDGLSLWSLALSLLLLINPVEIFDLSLQLTFAATWGLIVLSPALLRIMHRFFTPASWQQVVTLTLGAQMATFPLIAYHFGRISLTGLGANFLAVPMAGLLVMTGFLGLFLPFLNGVSYSMTRAIEEIAFGAASVLHAQIESQPLSLGHAMLWYVAFALFVAVMMTSPRVNWNEIGAAARDELGSWWQGRRDWWKEFLSHFWRWCSGILLLSALIWGYLSWQAHPRDLQVVILDVGQGDCILVRSPSGRTLLVDGGSSSLNRGEIGHAVIVPYLQSLGVQRLDMLALTHPDADHCNGLLSVVHEVPVDTVLDGYAGVHDYLINPAQLDPVAVDHFKIVQALQARKVPISAALAGQKFDLGGGVLVYVLAPSLPAMPGDNDNGLVLRVEYGTTSFLLTADIEKEAEDRLLQQLGPNALHCTVLKVAHHGSSTSTSEAFLQAAQPQFAAISCGRYNPFGHPRPEVLRRLYTDHVQTFRTDIDGTIEFTSDGHTCWPKTFR